MIDPGFLLVLIGLPLAALGTVAIGRLFDWWIERTTPMPLAHKGPVELREVLLEQYRED